MGHPSVIIASFDAVESSAEADLVADSEAVAVPERDVPLGERRAVGKHHQIRPTPQVDDETSRLAPDEAALGQSLLATSRIGVARHRDNASAVIRIDSRRPTPASAQTQDNCGHDETRSQSTALVLHVAMVAAHGGRPQPVSWLPVLRTWANLGGHYSG